MLQVSIFLLVGVILAGAALGYWIVRKFVISEDGSVDVGIAQFVKWAMRFLAATCIFQVLFCICPILFYSSIFKLTMFLISLFIRVPLILHWLLVH